MCLNDFSFLSFVKSTIVQYLSAFSITNFWVTLMILSSTAFY